MRRLATALVCTCGFLYAEGAWAQAVDKGKIWDANRGAVVKIHTFGTGANNSPESIDAGTGIFVSREGYILTALHVVGKDEDWSKVGPDHMPDRHVEVTLLNHAGSPHVISRNAYVKIIPGVDLALLRVDGHCFQYAKLAAQRPSGFPTLVAIVWGADTVPHPTSADLTEMTDVSLSGDKLTLDRIAAAGGYSGSPLFNAAGEVVGVLDNRLGDFRALAIPSTEAITSVQAITSVPVTNTDSNSCGPVPPVPDSLSIFYRLAGVEFGDPKDTVNSRFPHGTFDYHNNELLFYYRYKYMADKSNSASVHGVFEDGEHVNSIEWEDVCDPSYKKYTPPDRASCEQIRSWIYANFGKPTQHFTRGYDEELFFIVGGFRTHVEFIDERLKYSDARVPPPVAFTVKIMINR